MKSTDISTLLHPPKDGQPAPLIRVSATAPEPIRVLMEALQADCAAGNLIFTAINDQTEIKGGEPHARRITLTFTIGG